MPLGKQCSFLLLCFWNKNGSGWWESRLRDEQLQSQIIKILNKHQMLHSKDRNRTFGDNTMVKIILFPSDQTCHGKRLTESKRHIYAVQHSKIQALASQSSSLWSDCDNMKISSLVKLLDHFNRGNLLQVAEGGIVALQADSVSIMDPQQTDPSQRIVKC